MPRVERVLIQIQPVLFGAAIVLARFAEHPSATGALPRPLIVVAVVSALVSALSWALLRDRIWSPIVASLAVLFVLREAQIAAVFAAVGLWWLLVTLMRKAQGRAKPPRHVLQFTARAGGIFALAYLAVMGFSAYQATTVAPPTIYTTDYHVDGTGGPNIYMVMLDGYPRADTLLDQFQYDNGPFVQELSRMGFEVASESHSNYNKTWLTYASMLNGAYISDLLGDQPVPPDDASDIRWLYALINEASLLDITRQRGYKISTIPVPITTTSVTTADEYIDHGNLTELEAKIIWISPIAQLLEDQVESMLLMNQREGIEDALDTTASISEQASDQPQLVLTQVQSPHPPFALVPESQVRPALPPCFPDLCSFWQATIEELEISFEEYRERLHLQLDALNELVLDAVGRIVAADPDGVIVLWSDHGLRYSLGDTDEHLRSFLAARTPGAPGLFPSDESPVNLLRRTFARYLGADTPDLPYRAWLSNWDFTLVLTPASGDAAPP